MLVKTRELINYAQKNNEGIGAFNVSGLDILQAIISAAEEVESGVIVEFAPLHEKDGLVSLHTIGPVMIQMAKEAKVPVAVHLDHGVNLDYIKEALELGFTSVMYDGSALPYEDNVRNTIAAVELAKPYDVMVEGELGKMAGITLNNTGTVEDRNIDRLNFTNPLQAKDYVEKTGIDMLACSFGNSHGFYTAAPKLDFELLNEIYNETKIPLVMHGSSGVNDDDYQKVIDNGIRKINYYAYLSKAGADKIIESYNNDTKRSWQFHDFQLIAREAMKNHVVHAMKLFKNKK